MRPGSVTFVVPEALRFFLPSVRRHGEQVVAVDGTPTAGHVLASLGIPRTETGALLLDGRPVGLSYRPWPGDRIDVSEAPRPQAAPTSPPRFVLDVHLGALARRMRLLGLDTAYAPEAEDDALLETSLAERRILLTRDRGLLHRRALRWGAHVNHLQPDEQLREVVDRFEPPLAPWTRCLTCNGLLRRVEKTEVEAMLPVGTRRTQEEFRRCLGCGKVYWRGAHGDRLQRIVDAATA